MEIPPQEPSGHLPVGRFRARSADVRARYVDSPEHAASTTRRQIWSDWETATTHLRNIVPVCAAWLGGSFLSDRVDPDDLDVVYLIDARRAFEVRYTDPRRGAILELFAQNKLRAIPPGWRLDTFVLEWPVSQSTQRLLTNRDYHGSRGYWDDFWQRLRTGPKGTSYPEDALPRRGYLEVVLDDWSI